MARPKASAKCCDYFSAATWTVGKASDFPICTTECHRKVFSDV
jgi:hypothetical protein